MTAKTLSRKGQLLKLHLEQALFRCRLGLPLSPQNPFHQENTQEVLEAALLLARRQTQTNVLVRLFDFGLAFYTKDIEYDPSNKDHVTAQFLYDYFIEEPLAIHHVCDVSVTMVSRSRSDHPAILATRPTKPIAPCPTPTLPSEAASFFDPEYQFGVLGQDSIGPGEMCHPASNNAEFIEYSPLLENPNWTPLDAPLPDSPPYDLNCDPFAYWESHREPTDDEPLFKRPKFL